MRRERSTDLLQDIDPIAHDYAGVDPAIVPRTVRERLPELQSAVVAMLERLAQD